MDVGAPSNFERLRWLYRGDDAALRAAFTAYSVDGTAIRQTITARHRRYDECFVPIPLRRCLCLSTCVHWGVAGDWAVVATAHPAKFEQVVELVDRYHRARAGGPG